MKIAIGNDHAAVELKKTIMEYVESMGHEVTNFGTDSSESCNYPEYGEKVANAVASGEFDCGILICGTGVGISIAANKVNGIRAAVCSDTATARLVKQHNNANIIAFGERIVGVELAKDIDYKIKSCTNNENAGEATVTVEGTGDYSGTQTAKFTINKANLSDLKVEAKKGHEASFTYTGTQVKPTTSDFKITLPKTLLL